MIALGLNLMISLSDNTVSDFPLPFHLYDHGNCLRWQIAIDIHIKDTSKLIAVYMHAGIV